MSYTVNTILIVDDQPFVRMLLRTSLNELGDFDIADACNGEEAHAIVSQSDIDLIFCDLNMPDFDGLYLLQRLIGLKYSGAIVLISGEDSVLLNSTRVLATYYDLSILGIVAKPITAVQLKDYLHKADCATGTEKQSVDHLVSVKMLARYIEQGNVCAYFQPQYSISRSQIVGFEALARLQVNGRIIPPNQFISVAEQHCLIAPLTKAVIHVSLASFSKLEATHKSMTLSLNISSKVLEDEDFPYWLSAAAAQYGIDNQLIVCELTESHTSKEPAVVHVSLLRLRMLRFLLSIDDFGTGYASLTQLHALPFDELKIDRCFVMDLLTNEKSQAMCSRSLSLAKDLGLKSVAEGIEDQETLDFLQMLGCNIAQGFFLARPEPSDNAIERVNNNQIGLWEPLGDPVLSS